MRRAAAAVLMAALWAGCGDPEEGERCTKPHCSSDNSAAFFCDDGVYRRVECKGAGQCTEITKPGQFIFLCDVSGNVPGDHCPFSYNQYVGCNRDGKTALVCTQGFFKQRDCKTQCVTGTDTSDLGVCE